ncbi:MAG TPA: ABC transporter substrate-binding protein [Solirubrobacteraceae bacterium]|nr:ABC transporter substrate-binding protein [Solirubrobacteraceae bacterium]
MRSVHLLALVLALAVAGCGAGGGQAARAPDAEATLLLDFQPSAVHTGIYMATERGFDTAEGIDLDVQVPSSSSDAVRLLLAGETDFAVLDIHDLALAREQGRDLVAVMAIVRRPLASVLALPPVERPRDLEGERVGVTGLPSDEAVLDTVVAGDGGDPQEVERVGIGFNAVASLLGGEVAGATAFWNVEGLALRRERPEARIFRVEDFGAPRYPELLLTVTRETLQDRPAEVRATVAALVRGYERTLADPESAASTLVDATEGLERETVLAQLQAVQPTFRAGGRIGELNRAELREWAMWEAQVGITGQPPEVELMFDGGFVPLDTEAG